MPTPWPQPPPRKIDAVAVALGVSLLGDHEERAVQHPELPADGELAPELGRPPRRRRPAGAGCAPGDARARATAGAAPRPPRAARPAHRAAAAVKRFSQRYFEGWAKRPRRQAAGRSKDRKRSGRSAARASPSPERARRGARAGSGRGRRPRPPRCPRCARRRRRCRPSRPGVPRWRTGPARASPAPRQWSRGLARAAPVHRAVLLGAEQVRVGEMLGCPPSPAPHRGR